MAQRSFSAVHRVARRNGNFRDVGASDLRINIFRLGLVIAAAFRICPDYEKVVGRLDAAMSGSRGQDHDIADPERDVTPLRAAEAHADGAARDAEHFM